jgi:hypothetical protein
MPTIKDYARELADELAYRKPFIQEDNSDQEGHFCCVTESNDVYAVSYDITGIITIERLGQGLEREPGWYVVWSGQWNPETDVLEFAQNILDKEIGDEWTEDEDDEEPDHGNSEILNQTTAEYAKDIADGIADSFLYVREGNNDHTGGFCCWSGGNVVYTVDYDSSENITVERLDYDGWNTVWYGKWNPETDIGTFTEHILDGVTGDMLTEKDSDDDEDDEESEADAECGITSS